MNLNNFFQSKTFIGIIIGIGIVIVLLLTFKVGLTVGTHRADFAGRWSDNYHRNFGGPVNGWGGGMIGMMNDRNFMESRGAVGQIIKIDDSSLVVKGTDNLERVVVIDNNTAIEKFRDTIKIGDLKVDDYIVTIGEPNTDGQIVAKLIRVLPAPNGAGTPPPPPLDANTQPSR